MPPDLPTTTVQGLTRGVLTFVVETATGASGVAVRDAAGNSAIWAMTAPSATWPGLCARECSSIRQPRWSPDGTRLAFTAILETTPNSNVYVLDRQNRLQQLTSFGGGPPSRAPRGGVGTITAGTGETGPIFARPRKMRRPILGGARAV